MYKIPNDQLTIDDFKLPVKGNLKADNRWVKMVEVIPWGKIEEKYALLFKNNLDNMAKPARMALGSLSKKSAATARQVMAG